jgi:non-ribosomal peptide synthetase component F
LIGFFVNTLVLRTQLAGHLTFQEILRQVREVCLGAYAHQEIPFERIVEQLQPTRDLSHNPLFQVWFVLQNNSGARDEPLDNAIHPLVIDSGVARFDLTLALMENPERLNGFFEYNTDLFDVASIALMVEHFETLLQTVVPQPDIRLDAIKAILAETDKRHQIAKARQLEEANRGALINIKRRSDRKGAKVL